MMYENFNRKITLEHLWHASNILVRGNGMEIFERYCNQHNISYCDRNRCIRKAIATTGEETDLKELPCPDNMKGLRWDFYTKKMGYKREEAHALLKKIDASYENPFEPKIKEALKATKNMFIDWSAI